jgi:hypothetical protein
MVDLKALELRRVLWVPVAGWFSAHAVTLLRFTAVVIVTAVTVVGGFMCHNRIGPPG